VWGGGTLDGESSATRRRRQRPHQSSCSRSWGRCV